MYKRQIVSGPIPLPTHKRIFTVNRSTFVNKKSREQFELSSYKRLIDIYSSVSYTHLDVYKRQELKRKKFAITIGDELPAGIIQMAKVYTVS